jgi:CRISPR-associated endoribonuclease Cas6
MLDNFKSFHLKALDCDVEITNKHVTKELTKEDLAKSFYSDPVIASGGAARQSNDFEVEFLTSTSFKRTGSYEFQFDFGLFWQNLAMKYGYVFEQDKEVPAGLVEELVKHSKMLSYSLRSHYYNIGGKVMTKVPAFLGRMKFKVTGAGTLKNYARMLLQFGEFSGVGIKTSMGMGGFCLGRTVFGGQFSVFRGGSEV